MQAIIDVYRMSEIDARTRADIIVKLGRAINDQYGMNITEPIVYELVKSIVPDHAIITDDHYLRQLNPTTTN